MKEVREKGKKREGEMENFEHDLIRASSCSAVYSAFSYLIANCHL